MAEPTLEKVNDHVFQCSACDTRFCWNPENKKRTYSEWLRIVKEDFKTHVAQYHKERPTSER